jgi:ABC-type nickel/cobalt efflux system permease component RcnA
MLVVLTGLLLGCWHVVSGPDHLAAITPLATASDSERSGAGVGLAWGLGHASGVWLVGLVLLAFGSLIPLDLVGAWSERIVGVAIVGVGVWGLWRVRKLRRAEPEHVHDHLGHDGQRSALGIGLIHGVAGSSHLYGVLPALALTSSARLSYLAGFGVGSILAMGAFAGLLAMIVVRLPGSRELVRRWALLGASVVAIVVGTAWVALAF